MADEKPRRLLLIGQGPDGHPPTTHEFMAGLKVIEASLAGVPGLEITTSFAEEPWLEGPDLLSKADGALLYLSQGAQWMQTGPRRYDALSKLAARGGGLVALHWAVGGKEAQYLPGYLRLLGAAHGGPDRKYQKLETDIEVADSSHPVTQGIENFRLYDEFYYQLKLQPPAEAIVPLLRARIDGEPQMVAWCWDRPDGGRSLGFGGLHFHKNWQREEYRRLVAQGILWTLKMPLPEAGLMLDLDESIYALPEAKQDDARQD
ncbi:MAG: ThuA domain-containing protein [Pirellulales bacterium]|nr:ThuA domain-containing protein [Pirellulales bacterium]